MGREAGKEPAWPLGGSQTGDLGALLCLCHRHQFQLPVEDCMRLLAVLLVTPSSLAESSLRKGLGLTHFHIFFEPSKYSPVERISPGIQVYMENE